MLPKKLYTIFSCGVFTNSADKRYKSTSKLGLSDHEFILWGGGVHELGMDGCLPPDFRIIPCPSYQNLPLEPFL